MSQTSDYAHWLTKQQAADAIGVTTKTIERLTQDGQIQAARWQPEGRGPTRVVYHPDDVARIAAEKRQGPLPAFLVPGPTVPTNGNGPRPAIGEASALAIATPAPPPSEDVLRLLFGAALRAVSETSQTSALFLTIPEASAVSGLTQAYLRRRCEDGTLKALRDRGWRIRRKDLEAL